MRELEAQATLFHETAQHLCFAHGPFVLMPESVTTGPRHCLVTPGLTCCDSGSLFHVKQNGWVICVCVCVCVCVCDNDGETGSQNVAKERVKSRNVKHYRRSHHLQCSCVFLLESNIKMLHENFIARIIKSESVTLHFNFCYDFLYFL